MRKPNDGAGFDPPLFILIKTNDKMNTPTNSEALPPTHGSRSSETPRTDAALDKDWAILDESLGNVAKVSKELDRENKTLWMAGYSARYILDDLNNEPGMWQMAKLTGLPMGVIVSAFENIFAGSEISSESPTKH